jgi:hypothetical protein
MRVFFNTLILLCVLTAGASFVRAQAEGTWVGAVEGDDFIGAIRLDVSANADRSGSKVTLLFAGDKREGPIEGFTLSGDAVTFRGALRPVAEFSGKLTGDRMSGTLNLLRNGSRSLAARGMCERSIRLH